MVTTASRRTNASCRHTLRPSSGMCSRNCAVLALSAKCVCAATLSHICVGMCTSSIPVRRRRSGHCLCSMADITRGARSAASSAPLIVGNQLCAACSSAVPVPKVVPATSCTFSATRQMHAGMRTGLHHHNLSVPTALWPRGKDDPDRHTDHIRGHVPRDRGRNRGVRNRGVKTNGIATNLVLAPEADQGSCPHTLLGQSIVDDFSVKCERYSKLSIIQTFS